MSDEDEFNTILTTSLKGGGSVKISFPVPEKVQPTVLSGENVERAIEYYLLARYAFFHNMNSAFMLNSFWAVEHLILSILVHKFKTKDEIMKIGGPHAITKQWNKAKRILSTQHASVMSRFDTFVGKVMGYFKERYPEVLDRGKLQFTGKMPRVNPNDATENRALQFGSVAELNLEHLDHFVNFIIRDLSINGTADMLDTLLLRQDNKELYQKENKYSIIHPNKLYNGEMN